MYAHLYRTGRAGSGGLQMVLIISETVRPVGKQIPVSGKVEAWQVAAEHGAQPWNF